MKITKSLFENAIYYPCSNLDGFSFMFANTIKPEFGITNHVLVDYSTDEKDFLSACRRVKGYDMVDLVKLKPMDLCPTSWIPVLPPMLDIKNYQKLLKEYGLNLNTFAYLVKFYRSSEVPQSHEPENMNLIFIKGEAVATLQVLQQKWQFSPETIIVKNAGWGWGLGFEDFREPGNCLEWMILNDPYYNKVKVLSEVKLNWNKLHEIEKLDVIDGFHLYQFDS